MVKNTH